VITTRSSISVKPELRRRVGEEGVLFIGSWEGT
jgi:hypothetical protein